MYAVIDHDLPPRAGTQDALARELRRIMELQGHAIESRELLYSSPLIRALVEEEIPRLVSLCARRPELRESGRVITRRAPSVYRRGSPRNGAAAAADGRCTMAV